MKSEEEALRLLEEWNITGDILISREEAIEIAIAFFRDVGMKKTRKEVTAIIDAGIKEGKI